MYVFYYVISFSITISQARSQKVLKSGKHSLSNVGDVNSPLDNALKQATPFILSCYDQPEYDSMTSARQKIWSKKVSHSIGAAPKLQSLPPTNKAFWENVARVHLGVAIWRQDLEPNPPDLNPLGHSWIRIEGTLFLSCQLQLLIMLHLFLLISWKWSSVHVTVTCLASQRDVDATVYTLLVPHFVHV